MNRQLLDEGSLKALYTKAQDVAAELTEAAVPVVARLGFGGDWLSREIDLWKALTQTVAAWELHSCLSN